MALILVRHTTPDVSEGLCYGHMDLDVAPTFLAEAVQVEVGLPEIARIVTSPLTRCRKLADYMSIKRGVSVIADRRFMEMDFGTWEGQAWDDIDRTGLDAWATDFMEARPHRGESVAQLHARVQDGLADLRNETGSTLVVTHAGVIRAALARGATAEDFDTRVAFGQCVMLPSETTG